jgi:sulfur carrier protein
VKLTVNGRQRAVPDGCTVALLIEQLRIPARGVAVAVDGSVLPRGQWGTTLAENATVEVLTAVQGG